jgi:hypothetical protein
VRDDEKESTHYVEVRIYRYIKYVLCVYVLLAAGASTVSSQ